jgi:hypothetical protein
VLPQAAPSYRFYIEQEETRPTCDAGLRGSHAKSQSIRTRNLGPRAHDVALRAHIDAVPWLMLGIPAIEIVVVSRQRHEVLGSCALI